MVAAAVQVILAMQEAVAAQVVYWLALFQQ
jgi:hypothetical protein